MASLVAMTTPLLGRFFSRTLILPATRSFSVSAVGLTGRTPHSLPSLLNRAGTRRITRSGPTKKCPRCGTAIPLAACPCPECSGLVELDPEGTLSHFAILGYTNPEPFRSCSKWESSLGDEIRKLGARALWLDADEVVAIGNERLAALQPGRSQSLLDPEEEKRTLDRNRWRIIEAVRVLSDTTARYRYIADIYCRTSRYLPLGRGKTVRPIERTEEKLKATTNPLTVLDIKRTNDRKIRSTQAMIERALSAESPDGHGAKRFIYDLELYKRVDSAVRATKLLAV